jgi:ribosomal protein L9
VGNGEIAKTLVKASMKLEKCKITLLDWSRKKFGAVRLTLNNLTKSLERL